MSPHHPSGLLQILQNFPKRDSVFPFNDLNAAFRVICRVKHVVCSANVVFWGDLSVATLLIPAFSKAFFL